MKRFILAIVALLTATAAYAAQPIAGFDDSLASSYVGPGGLPSRVAS